MDGLKELQTPILTLLAAILGFLAGKYDRSSNRKKEDKDE